MQSFIEYWRSNALLNRQTSYKMALQDEETIGAISVLPRNSIEVVVGGDEQDTFWPMGKRALSECFWWKESSIERLTVDDGIVMPVWEPFLMREKGEEIKHV